MENASKALLIAGSVLIMILLLSLTVYVFRSMSASSSRLYAQLEASEITKFNQKFFTFEEKEELTMQDVVSVINLAKTNNKEMTMPVAVKVYVTGIGVDGKDLAEVSVNGVQTYSDSYILNLLQNNFDAKFTNCSVSYDANSKLIGRVDISGKITE